VYRALLLSFLLTAAAPAWADRVLLLVHGYLGDASSWQRDGVLPVLQQAGWQFGGNWQSTPAGVRLDAALETPGPFVVYTANLPSTAPLAEQARFLGGMLNAVAERHPDVGVDLVGHSAGGVVARLALVSYGAGSVRRLVTIASPHAGTERAWEALSATDDNGLFGGVKRWFVKRAVGDELYHTVRASRGALLDLAPPMPGNLLFWLNSQTHPDIEYIAVVRGAAYGMPGDEVVPAMSQDLNRIPALQGRARTVVMASNHLLSARDGLLLSELIAKPVTMPTGAAADR
jgi:pimeloyl-ACP methyl ester carboxylesterase